MIGLNKWERAVVLFVWLITQIFVLVYYGIYTKEEAEVYINIANRIFEGDFNHSIHYWLYSGYIGFLVAIRVLGLPFEAMYGVQLLASFGALICFVKLLGSLQLKRMTLLIGSIFFASSPLFHAWNSHLYTDGFFGSLVVIGLYLIIRNANASIARFLLLFIFMVFVSFVRPVGFLLPVLAVFYIWLEKISFLRGLLLTIWVICMLFLIKTSLTLGSEFFYPNHNLELNVICGYPSTISKYEAVSYNKEMSIFEYFILNPRMTLALILNRAYKSLWMTRPFFSSLHNIILAFACLLYYILAVIGIVSAFRKKNIKIFYFLIFTVVWLVPNILFCADWHNRFMIPMIPGLLIMVTLGTNFILENLIKGFNYKKKNGKNSD